MTTLVAVAASAVALIPMALIVEFLIVDAAEAADLPRLAATFAPADPRDAMPPLSDDLPRRLSPSDLPARWDTDGLAATELGSRARHRLGEARGTVAQQARWNTPTGQFWLIVEQLGDLDEPCSHCAAPEDGERPHAGCPGCCCPCGTPPLPEGVDGYAIAGATR